jgi:hypothetical protein
MAFNWGGPTWHCSEAQSGAAAELQQRLAQAQSVISELMSENAGLKAQLSEERARGAAVRAQLAGLQPVSREVAPPQVLGQVERGAMQPWAEFAQIRHVGNAWGPTAERSQQQVRMWSSRVAPTASLTCFAT